MMSPTLAFILGIIIVLIVVFGVILLSRNVPAVNSSLESIIGT